jgi:hypothetical protein
VIQAQLWELLVASVWKPIFRLEGPFEWSSIPFKLTNAPTKFMWMIDDILQTFTNSFVVIFLEDILIFKLG